LRDESIEGVATLTCECELIGETVVVPVPLRTDSDLVASFLAGLDVALVPLAKHLVDAGVDSLVPGEKRDVLRDESIEGVATLTCECELIGETVVVDGSDGSGPSNVSAETLPAAAAAYGQFRCAAAAFRLANAHSQTCLERREMSCGTSRLRVSRR
jgi:hypothetical protein